MKLINTYLNAIITEFELILNVSKLLSRCLKGNLKYNIKGLFLLFIVKLNLGAVLPETGVEVRSPLPI